MLLSVPLGQHALERGKYLSFYVPLDQDVCNEGNIYCVPFHSGNTLFIEREKYILLSVLLGLIQFGQHAFRTREIYVAFVPLG